jgi:hypothetical protein
MDEMKIVCYVFNITPEIKSGSQAGVRGERALGRGEY